MAREERILSFSSRIAEILDEAMERTWLNHRIIVYERAGIYADCMVVGLAMKLPEPLVHNLAEEAARRYEAAMMDYYRRHQFIVLGDEDDEGNDLPDWRRIPTNDNHTGERSDP